MATYKEHFGKNECSLGFRKNRAVAPPMMTSGTPIKIAKRRGDMGVRSATRHSYADEHENCYGKEEENRSRNNTNPRVCRALDFRVCADVSKANDPKNHCRETK